MSERVVIVSGPSGAGKTSFGDFFKKLPGAEWVHFDTDVYVYGGDPIEQSGLVPTKEMKETVRPELKEAYGAVLERGFGRLFQNQESDPVVFHRLYDMLAEDPQLFHSHVVLRTLTEGHGDHCIGTRSSGTLRGLHFCLHDLSIQSNVVVLTTQGSIKKFDWLLKKLVKQRGLKNVMLTHSIFEPRIRCFLRETVGKSLGDGVAVKVVVINAAPSMATTRKMAQAEGLAAAEGKSLFDWLVSMGEKGQTLEELTKFHSTVRTGFCPASAAEISEGHTLGIDLQESMTVEYVAQRIMEWLKPSSNTSDT
uniref:Uncharacterized protein n=1 Tax=Chromera velia CCMP2878 TaxID=1169474 RepID=A0A0G4F8W1_9ALVE|eukprot:Cvel_15765.t1-p1 / transcript=Cvel_15765.t1 / gene=Cvel_15765 / organism=Chromera_velia_CCMP2878 / gene_product=hypothetical protein / transcript_product=hypothetical protein / location=Cvel_scaffold1181:42878-43798(-) / protein_length=307 / sequence_SO=supercontig / SO=protein_coding / is_pseudo=false